MSLPAQAGTRKLLTILGVTFGLAVTIGNVIGAGILRTPGAIAEQLPTFWTFVSVWLIGGLYALLGANSVAELGTMVPRSGGQYVFVRRGLGDYAGLVVGWSDWISTSGTTAAVALVVGEYAVRLFPALRSPVMVALMTIAILTIIQWFGIRSGELTQNFTSLLKFIALVVLVVACFWLGGRVPWTTSFVADREGSVLLAYIIALQGVIYTYDGWSAVIYFSEEVKDSGRNIPRAMLGGVTLIIVIYVLLNVAFLRVVPLATIAGEDMAAGVVAQALFGPKGDTIIRSLMVIALLSALNSNILMAPRVVFAMANDRLFWRGAREVNAGGTPDVALLISSLVAAALLVIDRGRFDALLAKLAFFFVINYGLSLLAVFVLRWREPDTPRPYRAWGHPFTTGLALLASILFLVGAVAADRTNSVHSLIILALTVPIYFVLRIRRMSS